MAEIINNQKGMSQELGAYKKGHRHRKWWHGFCHKSKLVEVQSALWGGINSIEQW